MAPSIPDEVLAERVAAYEANDRNQTRAAAAAGCSRETMQRSLRRAGELGMFGYQPVIPGMRIAQVTNTPKGDFIQQKPEHGPEFEVPAGHKIKGVSALVDADGNEIIKWVKTREEATALDIAETLKAAFVGYEPAAAVSSPPRFSHPKLLNLIPANDWHVNLLTWERETGVNWDLKIAERVIGGAIEDAIARTPPAGTAIVLGGGDLNHADNNENRTAKSGNVLDSDGRHQKGLEVACRLMVRTVDAALKKNQRVIVRVLQGNHDEQTSVAVAYFMLAWFRNDPRVVVDVDASLFFWHRFGSVMLGATHGHTVKLQDMAMIMAHRRAEDWGVTKFRYIHGFHVHHQSKFQTEGQGVIMESHQAPIPQDAWHFGAGFLSGRSVQTIQYHEDFGEIGRVRVAILDSASAANDNVALANRMAA